MTRRKSLAPDELAAALAALADVALPDGKRIADARAADLSRAEAGQWEAFISKGLAKSVATHSMH